MSENILLQLQNVSKSFPGVKALQDVSFDVRAGEVHALLGENGAGKSTLMKIIAGIYTKDSGGYYFNNKPIEKLTPKSAQEHGIAIIHQELNMCGHLSVAENMFLGREFSKAGVLSKCAANTEARKYLRMLNVDIDPHLIVKNLTVAMQQMIEIAKAISLDAQVIIMDEPTSSLTKHETTELFRVIKDLRAQGRGIVYISHKLEELRHIVDRVSVFRDGRHIITEQFTDIPEDKLIAYMVGREITEKFPRVQCPVGGVVFEARNICAPPEVRDVSFTLRTGEIVGVAGLIGAGRTETMKAIFGLGGRASGEVFVCGKKTRIKDPRDAIKAGIVYIPEDRKQEGLCLRMSVKENMALPNADSVAGALGVVSGAKELEIAREQIRNLSIKTPSPYQDVINLSGGNQQKIVVGKWLARQTNVVIFDEPTRGVDVAAKVEIYSIMNKLKQNGVGVMFISSEMPEILGMSDRVLVIREGRVAADLVAAQTSQHEIMSYAARYHDKYVQA